MKTKLTTNLIAALLCLIVIPGVVLAQREARTGTIREISEERTIIRLGEARDVEGRRVEGFQITDYAHRKKARPLQPSGASCYSPLAQSARWRNIEPWIINPSNKAGLDEGEVVATTERSMSKWEDAADGFAGNGKSVDIFGPGSATGEQLSLDISRPDGRNELYFGRVPKSGAVAVTVIWGIFNGSASGRQIVEWDQVYDDTRLRWSTDGRPDTLDLESVLSHELGHALGLRDIYSNDCSTHTMFGFVDYGETHKRALKAGDTAGAWELYR